MILGSKEINDISSDKSGSNVLTGFEFCKNTQLNHFQIWRTKNVVFIIE